MANSNRLAKRYLAELANDPEQLHTQGFTPLVRYLAANAPLATRVGYSVSPKQDFVRFGQTALLHFYPAAFTDVKFNKTTSNYKLNNSYWGMLGINGPLPTHLTEYAIERNYRLQDSTFTGFLDVFNHRFISLFYRAWADAEPTVSHDRPEEDNFQRYLNALSGECTSDSSSEVFNQHKHVHQYLSGLLSHKNRSGKVLTQLLAEYLHFEVSIEEFQGRWYDLEPNDQTRLGQQNAALGCDTMLGSRTFQRSFNFAINIGPIYYQEYIALLNNSRQLSKVIELTKKVLGQEYEFSINILLKAKQTQACQLGSALLGINSWSQDKSGHLQQREPKLVYTTSIN